MCVCVCVCDSLQSCSDREVSGGKDEIDGIGREGKKKKKKKKRQDGERTERKEKDKGRQAIRQKVTCHDLSNVQ